MGRTGIKAVVVTPLGGLILTAHLLTAPQVSADDCSTTIAKNEASEAQDAANSSKSHTGNCWQNPGANWGVSEKGSSCVPGSIGMCLAALQNNDGSAQRTAPTIPATKQALPPQQNPVSWP